MTLGEAIRETRKARGLSQREVTRRCGFSSVSYLSRIEHDHLAPRIHMLDRIATVGIGVKASDIILLWETGESNVIVMKKAA